ncbi:MAG: flavodoxin [Candidatus Omnitrophota bacterium]
MRSLIIYYSYSGHTGKVAGIFADILKGKGTVDLQPLKPKDEITSFFAQCRAAFARKRAELEDGPIYNVSAYDLIIIGSPVWAFAPTPAVNTYLDKVNGLHGKRVVVLLNSGSGAGVKKCFDNIEQVLRNKGASDIARINIPDRMLNDGNFISGSLEKVL